MGARAAVAAALVAASLVILPSGAASLRRSADDFPVFDIGGDDHSLGQLDDIYADIYSLDAAPQPAVITIRTPPGYRVAPVHRANYVFGEADVYTNRGTYDGELEVAPKAGFDADPATEGCAGGDHASDWWMVLNGPHGELSVPIAVDRKGKGYLLTICLGSLHKLKLKTSEIYFETRNVFRNPSKPGVYRFSALVTPAGTGGKPDATQRYELRADQPLPEDDALTSAVYDPAAKKLTLTGSVHADGRARTGINVHVFESATHDFAKEKEIGVAVTTSTGAYTFARRFAKPPNYVYTYVDHYRYQICAQASAAPGGCASESTDGAASDDLRVEVKTPKPASSK